MNLVILSGNIAAKPIKRVTPDGTTVTNFRVATDSKWTDKETGEKKSAPQFHTCVTWGRRAEIAAEYLDQGSGVLVQGELRHRTWKDKESGEDRYATEVLVTKLELGSKPSSRDKDDDDDAGEGQGLRPKDL